MLISRLLIFSSLLFSFRFCVDPIDNTFVLFCHHRFCLRIFSSATRCFCSWTLTKRSLLLWSITSSDAAARFERPVCRLCLLYVPTCRLVQDLSE